MDSTMLQKAFPAYFECFHLPECAVEQELTVYRACKTRKVEKESFLNTYEENGFSVPAFLEPNDPQVYSLSTFEKLRDIRRFVCIDSKYDPPYALAKGKTVLQCGVACRTKEWRPEKKKSSHVDWWLYEGATPWLYFEEVDYHEELSAHEQP